MKAARLIPTLLAAGVALGALTAGVTSTASAEPHPLCKSSSKIPARALAKGVRSAGCDLTGRVVQAGNVGAKVPPPGLTVRAEGLVPAGAAEAPILEVTNDNGVVTARELRAVDAHEHDGEGADTMAAGSRIPPGCLQNTRINPWPFKWKSYYNWYFQMRSTPARYSKLIVEHHIKTAAGNVAAGHNACGLKGDPQLTQVFRGRTAQAPHIYPSGSSVICGSRPNQHNVVGFKNIPHYLGYACIWTYARDHGRIYGADIVIDNDNRGLVTSIPANCSNKWDLQGLMTHEFGHTAGFNHANNITYTMNPSLYPCDHYARTFTRNEWYGLKQKYGVR